MNDSFQVNAQMINYKYKNKHGTKFSAMKIISKFIENPSQFTPKLGQPKIRAHEKIWLTTRILVLSKLY